MVFTNLKAGGHMLTVLHALAIAHTHAYTHTKWWYTENASLLMPGHVS